MSRFLRGIGATASIAIALGLATSAPALADANVFDVYNTVSFSDTGLTDGCLPGQTGKVTGTMITNLQVVLTGPDGIHVSGTVTETDRIDWIPSGDYTITGSTDRIAWSGTLTPPAREFTVEHSDFGNVFDPSGDLLFRETFRDIFHWTFLDGAFVVRFDRGHLTVIGSDCTP